MKIWLCTIINFIFLCANAQLRSPLKKSLSHSENSNYSSLQLSKVNPRLQRYTSPRLVQATPNISDRTGSSYWTNAVTTQSYGKGKWGTMYFWDIQGNLRESKGFIDIAGKNKRGLKLVFPWR